VRRLLLGFSKSSFGTRIRAYLFILLILIFIFLLAGCARATPISTATIPPSQAIPTRFENLPTELPFTTQTFNLAPSPSTTSQPITIWLAPYLPEKMRAFLILPPSMVQIPSSEGANISISIGNERNSADSLWVFALVAPFPTIPDGITSDELHLAWVGEENPSFNSSPLLMDENTLQLLTAFWGEPSPQAVQIVPSNQLRDYAWDNQPSWAIIPFEQLEPRWKVLTIDGQSPVRKDFDPLSYELTIPFSVSADGLIQPDNIGLLPTNRDPSKLTTVALTGVTAMVRATAYTMEQEGITYPALDIGSLLAQADITHISNEIPFSPDCPYPTPTMDRLVFCSSPRYIDLLKAVGTDIVELTGDHFMDYGAEATLYTLQMYKELGWPYYGGGANAKEARQPVKLENNGNRIAFMGCNIGCQVKNEIPCDAIATDEHPGAAQCDFNWISSEIPALRDEGYQVIFTFQHREYYTYTIEPILANDFGLVAAAGATIVSGSQAHQAHGFAFDGETYIHYGLGNLFFDQYHYCVNDACDDAFIDQHVFYDGQYISTELITIHFVDFARPRLMTGEERQRFLEKIFNASDW
jgi:hypothetical protein